MKEDERELSHQEAISIFLKWVVLFLVIWGVVTCVTRCNAVEIINGSPPDGLAGGTNSAFSVVVDVGYEAQGSGNSVAVAVPPGGSVNVDQVNLSDIQLYYSNYNASLSSISSPSGSGFPTSGVIRDDGGANWKILVSASGSALITQTFSYPIIFLDGCFYGMSTGAIIFTITIVKRGLRSGV